MSRMRLMRRREKEGKVDNMENEVQANTRRGREGEGGE